MKALSLWQPWASFVADGHKAYETRSWSTRYRGPLAIHATKRWTRAEQAAYEHLCFLWALPHEELPLGVVLCTCELTAIYDTQALRPKISLQEQFMGDYSPGRYAWRLENVQVFDTPIPAKGMQGLWEWSK